MSGAERRANPRFDAKPGHYAAYKGGSGPLRDISLGGVFIQVENPLPEGTSFVFILHLDAQELIVRGVVRRALPNAGMAVQFQQVSPEARDRLDKFLESVWGAASSGGQGPPPP